MGPAEAAEVGAVARMGDADASGCEQRAATGSDRDDGTVAGDALYSYSFLLGRLRERLGEDHPSHPSLRSADKHRSKVPPPQLARVGGRRVAVCNFGSICAALSRPTAHVQSFFLSELATTGSLDEKQETLTVLAALQAKGAEQILRKYVHEYVACEQCKALETAVIETKGRGGDVLRCGCCGAERLLAPIKSGFRAVRRGERRANREG